MQFHVFDISVSVHETMPNAATHTKPQRLEAQCLFVPNSADRPGAASQPQKLYAIQQGLT